MYITSTREDLPHHPSFKSLLSANKIFGSLQRPIASANFEFKSLAEFETEFEKNVVK
jgi:hypothetical protein